MRPDILNVGQSNGSKTQTAPNSIGNSPTTPKHVPSFLEGRNQMKGSLFMNEEGSAKNKTEGSYYNGFHTDQNTTKRVPRMSEQPDMKFSAIEFGNDSYGKIPSFLHEKPDKKEKKVPYQNDLERP